MMTVAFGLLALFCFFLWRSKAQWGWAVVVAVLVIGVIIFMRDVDFTSNLGVQL
jgi:hypothetical protein